MTDTKATTAVTLVAEEIQSLPSLAGILERLGSQAGLFVLGDFAPNSPGRYSYLGFGPVETLTLQANQEQDPLEQLNAACERYRLVAAGPVPVPFVGGWVGYLSYDLKGAIERLPDRVVYDIGLPLARFGFYDQLLAWDHQENRGYVLALRHPGQRSDPADRIRQLRQLCEHELHPSGGAARPAPSQQDVPATEELVKHMQANISHRQYLQKVARAVEYIKAGDIFEVNLSQRFSCSYGAEPGSLYQYLTVHNPAAYCGLLIGRDHAVVSASPELFLKRRGLSIITRPIKGTIARGGDPGQDVLNRQELLRSEKDHAELNMVIDLERNDLGRVCSFGSVKVLEERVIETHPTIFHAVATIAGQLRAEVSLAEVLRATFPGGSITGAPKIRAMEIIDELEPTARSVYTGSIGWIGVNGDMDLNIAIRTIILAGARAYVQVGGAVVADSQPQAEYDETLAKAAALVKALHMTKHQQAKIVARKPTDIAAKPVKRQLARL